MSDPMLWWADSPADQRWHLLPDPTRGRHLVVLPEQGAARCGQRLPSDGERYGTPYGLKCPSCEVVFRVWYSTAQQRGRLWLPYHRLDTGHRHTLLLTHQWDGAWTLHCPAAAGMWIEATIMVAACQAVLQRARPVGGT